MSVDSRQRQIGQWTEPAGPPAARQLRPRAAGLVLGVVMVIAMSGCMFPSANYLPDYVANRDGRYYVGEHCRPNLTDVAVSTNAAWTSGSQSVDLGLASWRAVADPTPVREFELYSNTQAGVVVVTDDKTRPLTEDVTIYVRADGEQWRSMTLPLGPLEVGSVASSAGRMTWEKFMAMPDRDFGC